MNMCPSNKRKNQPELCLKGQVFFIWSSLQSLEIVKDRISLLGGKVDTFLSRDVTTVLVEDNHLVGSQLPSKNLAINPVYSANGTLVTSFPYTNNLCNLPSTSRGFNLVAATSSNSPYRVICYALQWGIQVLGIDQFLTWIEPQVKTAIHLKKKATENVSKLSGCFIKFENLYKTYRPCYKMFNNDPDRLLPLKNANVLVKADTCNVILDKPIASRQLHFSHMDTHVRAIHPVKNVNVAVKANDKKPPNNKLRPKEENNYCECCRTHFADLKNHIKSVKHQNFVSNEKNYESVHNIIKMLPTAQEFIEKLQNPSPNPGLVLANGDTSICMAMANTPDTDYPVPVNLQVRRETAIEVPMPMDLHVEKGKIFPVSPTIYVKRDEKMPLPLDLHVKRDTELMIEAKDIKQEVNLFADLEPIDSCKKTDLQAIPPKLQIREDEMTENIKFDEKTPEIPEDLHCDALNGDPLFDRTNTAALAQLCLKNFDSYWLDSLPCEMDDIVFDDIFDIDDGKMKFDNECSDPLGENFVTSDIAQTPGMVSGISTPNLKTPTNTNMSFYMNTPIDIKDIKSEATNLHESFPSNCKLEKDMFSSQNIVTSFNEPLIENKNKIFSIAQFCANKVNVDAIPSCSSKIDINAPSCSNAISNNNTELLFSSESSDDENENVLISNVLHMITNNNSDSDLKVGKESDEDNSAQGNIKVTAIASVQKNSVQTKIGQRSCEEPSHKSENPVTIAEKTQYSGKESLPDCEMKKDIFSYKKSSLQPQEDPHKNMPANEMKIDIYSYKKKSFQTQEDSQKQFSAIEKKTDIYSYKKKSLQSQDSQKHLPVIEIKTDICSYKKKSLKTQGDSQQNLPTNKVKKDINHKKSSLPIKKSSCNMKIDKRHGKNSVPQRRNSSEMKGNDHLTVEEDSVPLKKVCSGEENIVKQNTVRNATPELNSVEMKSSASCVEKKISVDNYGINAVPLQDQTFSEISMDLNSKEISSPASSVFSENKLSRESSKGIPILDKTISSDRTKLLKDSKESSLQSKSGSSDIKVSTERPNEISRVAINEENTKGIQISGRRISSGMKLSKEISLEVSLVKNICSVETEIHRPNSAELSSLQSNVASVDMKLNKDFKSISVTEKNICPEIKLSSEILATDKNAYSYEREHFKEDSKVVQPINFSETKIASDMSNKISNFEKNISSIDVKFKVDDFKAKPAKVNSIYLGKTKIFEESEVTVKNDSPSEMKIFERTGKCLSSIKNSPSSEMKVCRENENKFLVSVKESPKTYEESSQKQIISETTSSYKTNIYGDSYGQNCIPVKKRSREISVSQSVCGGNYVKLKTSDDRVEQSVYQKCPVKRQHSTDDKTLNETGKIEPIVVKKHCLNETSVIKQTKKTSIIDSANPCQYLNTTEKITADICPPSNMLPPEPVISDQTVKIPHKKPAPKLQKLPPLWSVSILPGSGVKLKFTCIHPQNVDTHQATNREYPLSGGILQL